MQEWRRKVNADPTEWLLEPENPSVRYATLKDLLDKPGVDADVEAALADIMKVGPVPKVLAKQAAGGYWGVPGDFYIRSKYKGTVWSLILLAELDADGADDRVRKAGEFILQNSQDRKSGGFSYVGTPESGGDHARILPCLTGNMVWCLIEFGFLDDPRVQKGIDWICHYQRFDDGDAEPATGWPYDKFSQCWGRHTCHMGVVKALKALAAIPPAKRNKEVREMIVRGAEYLLHHHIFKRSHDLQQVSKPAWVQLGFPLMWNTDVLEILDILTRLGYKDERMQEAIDTVLNKQNAEGKWKLEATFANRMQVNLERKGQPSKWVTLHACRVLKRFFV